MSNIHLLALFVCSLVSWTVGTGMLPLLPIHAINLGANPTAAGYYLAFTNLALAVGTLAAGWISDRFNRRKIPLIIAGLMGTPTLWLMGRAGNIWSLSLLTAVSWAGGGMGFALIGILAGLSAGEHERGKIFGILSLTSGLGALIGGLSTGFIADRWGYPAMFSAVAVFTILTPLAGLFLKEIRASPGPVPAQHGQALGEDLLPGKRLGLGRDFQLLFSASILSAVAGYVIMLGRSLLMSDLGFGAFAISSTVAVGGVVAMPVPLVMGWLSDRTGRKVYIYLMYLLGIASLLGLAVATSLWGFFFVSILQAVAVGVNVSVGNAFVTDLVPRPSIGRGLALFSGTVFIGGILGFAGAGYAFQSFGMLPTFFIGTALLLIAILLLLPIRTGIKGQAAIASSG